MESGQDLGVVDSLVQLSFVLQAVLAAVAADHDLSLVALRLLGILRDREPGMLELAGYLNLEKSSVTGLVDRAERRGLVRRVAAPADRRAVRVQLTAKGRALFQQGADDVATRVATMADGLSHTERGRLSQLASRLVHADADARQIDLSAGLLQTPPV